MRRRCGQRGDKPKKEPKKNGRVYLQRRADRLRLLQRRKEVQELQKLLCAESLKKAELTERYQVAIDYFRKVGEQLGYEGSRLDTYVAEKQQTLPGFRQ